MFAHLLPAIVAATEPQVTFHLQPAAAVPSTLTWLSPAEMRFLETLSVKKRRRDWLLGRWTSKRLVAHVQERRNGTGLDFAAITIHKDPDGAPRVDIAPGLLAVPPMTLSLSHSNEVGAAALVEKPDWPLGIDLEKREPRHPGFVGDYFTDIEQAQLTGLTGERYQTAVNAIWSGKEAALKAVRQGLTQDTRALSCVFDFTITSDCPWSSFDILWDSDRLSKQPPALTGRWQVVDGFVLTVVSQLG